MTHWKKQGLVFTPEDYKDWMVSHACTPTAYKLDNDTFRIFFSPRNNRGQSLLASFDIEIANPTKILNISEKPLMPLGELGAFDDGGIMPCSVVDTDDGLYLYYVGWNPSGSVPYRNAIGLAISHDHGKTFERPFPGAVVDRNREEPFFTASPYVMKEGSLWQMWYASSTGFTKVNGKVEPLYIIKYARSKNGIDWERHNHTCIEPKEKGEANARASVLKENGIYKMWYCFRGSEDFRDGSGSYRLGYAESKNAVDWERKDDQVGIGYSEKGWDSTMQTYPNVIAHNGKKYLFYNGNGFGKTGIGLAIAE